MVQDRVQYWNLEYSNESLSSKGGEKFLEQLSLYRYSRNILPCGVTGIK
jgi:hypothetical protein